jgi:hypothetical protein
MDLPWEMIASLFDWPTALVSAGIALFVMVYARPVRALVIWIAQYASFLALIFTVAVAGRAGYATGGTIGQTQNINEIGQLYYAIAGAVVGGVAGLVGAALVISVFFVLLEIRENTKG